MVRYTLNSLYYNKRISDYTQIYICCNALYNKCPREDELSVHC